MNLIIITFKIMYSVIIYINYKKKFTILLLISLHTIFFSTHHIHTLVQDVLALNYFHTSMQTPLTLHSKLLTSSYTYIPCSSPLFTHFHFTLYTKLASLGSLQF